MGGTGKRRASYWADGGYMPTLSKHGARPGRQRAAGSSRETSKSFDTQRAIHPDFKNIMRECRALIEAGAALHWLKSTSKAPIEDGWSSAPRYTSKELTDCYREGANIGIRLGEPSKTKAGYIHVIDVDIRTPEAAAEAWAEVSKLVGNPEKLPSVISGSGGLSRHFYFWSETPLKSRKISKSVGFSMVYDSRSGCEVKKSDWEIELFGTGKQVVLPPSIHPETGHPYRWEREIDFTLLKADKAPILDTSGWAEKAVDDEEDDDLFRIVRTEPLKLTPEEIMKYLAVLSQDWVEDRDSWLQVGMALSHQFQGGQRGFEIWCDWSSQSDKFEMRGQKASWKSFKGVRNPVTMRTIIQAAQERMLQANLPIVLAQSEVDPFDELLGTTTGGKVEASPIADWTSLLARNKDGQPIGGLHNVHLISANDARTSGCLAFSNFKQETVIVSEPKKVQRDRVGVKNAMVQLDAPHWKVNDPVNGRLFTDVHFNDLRRMIEAPKSQGGYGIKISDRDLKAAVEIVARQNSFHPVKDYINAAVQNYDGGKRVDTLFIDYLGCADTPYHREAARLLLLGAVARIYEPGHKFDFVPILEGLQGKRKSTFIRVLGRDWSSELVGDFHDNRAMVEQIMGVWIVEIPELQGFSKADTNVLKAFLSRSHDKARLAYQAYAQTFPRQCVFIGSTNDEEYLRDHTGGRRFWPIKCELEGEIDTDRLQGEIDHIWAEAYLMYCAMREACKLRELPLFLSSEAARSEAKLLQESRRLETAEDNLAGTIQKWLDEPLGADSGFDDLEADAPRLYRNETCVMHIWVDMMGNEAGRLSTGDAIKIGRALGRVPGWSKAGQRTTKKYGIQRTYQRDNHPRQTEL